jgi:hypothetical protein
MATRNARNLIILSRYGPRTEAAYKLLEELREQNIVIEAPACDIVDIVRMREIFEALLPRMPPIKGCLQASILAKVGHKQRHTNKLSSTNAESGHVFQRYEI